MKFVNRALPALSCLFCAHALAQPYPAKSIRIVVPFPPGAFNDTLGRTISQKFTEGNFSQTVVDNRPGAGSTIGTDIVAKSPADGYTLLIVAVPFAVNATLYARLPFDTLKDFTGVIHAGATPNMLVMHPSVPVRSVKELIALAKAKPAADAAFESGDYTTSLKALAVLKAPVDAFFEKVMVNAEDPLLRANRLGLLATLHAAMNRVADLSTLAT